MFLKFRSGTHWLFEELGRHDKGGGSQDCPDFGACKESVEHVLFKCADAFKAFLHDSIFDKTVLCLGEKQGMLVNDECSSWYIRVGDFKYEYGIGENNFCTPMDQLA